MRTKLIRVMGLGILMGTFFFGMNAYADTDTYGRINSENAVMKEVPIIEVAPIKNMKKDEVVRTGNIVDEYIEVILEDETVVYVESRYIDKVEEKKAPVEEEKVEEPKQEKGAEIVKYALQFVGNPYVYGGNSLTNGTDCSGFTSSVYKQFGVNIQRSSRSQFASNGVSVSKSELKAGDLIFYGYNGSVSHVALYMGDGKIVHASTPKTGICISPMEQRGMAPYMGAKRII